MSTAEEARKLVSYAKFPVPKAQRTPEAISGIRGAGSPFAPAVFGQGMGDYIATANRNTFVAVQIETVEGLENCEEIAKVDGVGQLNLLWFTRCDVSDGLCRYAFRWVRYKHSSEFP